MFLLWYDTKIQLYWVSSRYYSPELSRWISPDSIEYLDSQSINGLNLYAYCGNDLVNKCDPTGHSPEWWQCTLSGAALVDGYISEALGGSFEFGAAIRSIVGGLTAGQGLITGGFYWDNVGLSAMFGFAGGAIGITKWGEGIRNIIVGAGLGLGESSISEIIEWWQSRQQTNMAYLRFAY